MGVKQRVPVQHDDVPADPQPRGQPQGHAAGPTGWGFAATGLELVDVVEVFSIAVAAVKQRVAQAGHD